MNIAHPEFVPNPQFSREEMQALQQSVAEMAVFADSGTFDGDDEQESLRAQRDTSDLLVAGVDQAFDGETAVSAVVVMRGDSVVERTHAVEPAEIPYIPGLLSFREGGAILSALTTLDTDPDVLLVDGSGRIHYREAGLATHIGVTLDVPAVGVAKGLLCGRPTASITGMSEGERVPIEADSEVTAEDETVIGYAVQTRQYDSPNRHINPLYVSPGHAVSAETAADLVAATAIRYKLPEPIRRADQYAAELTK